MAELEKRLAELEIAVGSGSDKQVHTDFLMLLSFIHTNPLYLLLSFILTPAEFSHSCCRVTIHKVTLKSHLPLDLCKL